MSAKSNINKDETILFSCLGDVIEGEDPVTRDSTAIVGGETAIVGDGLVQLRAILAPMRFRIVELFHSIRIEATDITAAGAGAEFRWDDPALVRLRLFGEQGDAAFRRDGTQWHWNFVGEVDLGARLCDALDGDSFWDHGGITQLTARHDAETMLWGVWRDHGNAAKKPGQWLEPRVGAADLRYPVDGSMNRDRILLQGSRFLHKGVEQFVWWKKFQLKHPSQI